MPGMVFLPFLTSAVAFTLSPSMTFLGFIMTGKAEPLGWLLSWLASLACCSPVGEGTHQGTSPSDLTSPSGASMVGLGI